MISERPEELVSTRRHLTVARFVWENRKNSKCATQKSSVPHFLTREKNNAIQPSGICVGGTHRSISSRSGTWPQEKSSKKFQSWKG